MTTSTSGPKGLLKIEMTVSGCWLWMNSASSISFSLGVQTPSTREAPFAPERSSGRSALKDYRRHHRPRQVATMVALRRASRPAISPTRESLGLASNHPPALSCWTTCGTRPCTHHTGQSDGRHGTGPLSSRSDPWTDCRSRTRAARGVVRRASDLASHRRGRSSERPTSARVDAATHTARVARCASPQERPPLAWNTSCDRARHQARIVTQRPSRTRLLRSGATASANWSARARNPSASPLRTTSGSHGAVKSRRGSRSTSASEITGSSLRIQRLSYNAVKNSGYTFDLFTWNVEL